MIDSKPFKQKAPRTELQKLAGEQNFFLGSMHRYYAGLVELSKRELALANPVTQARFKSLLSDLWGMIGIYKHQFECDRESVRVDTLQALVQDEETRATWLTAAYEYNKKYHTPGTISGLNSTKKEVFK